MVRVCENAGQTTRKREDKGRISEREREEIGVCVCV